MHLGRTGARAAVAWCSSAGSPEKGLIATWRPGDAGYLVRPFDRPETPASAPVDTRFPVV
jgi:hypothetical protein